jgi:hypothetical protein
MLDPNPDCSKIAPLLDAFHDGELPEADKQEVKAHLTTCEACPARLREIEGVVASLHGLPRFDMPRRLELDWNALLEKEEQPVGERQVVAGATSEPGQVVSIAAARKMSIRRAVVAAAAGLVVLVVAAGFMTRSQLPVPIASMPDNNVQGLSIRRGDVPLVAEKLADRHLVSQSPPDGSKPEQLTRREGRAPSNQAVAKIVDSDLIALYSNDANLVSEELGIATDEDGLYALKL